MLSKHSNLVSNFHSSFNLSFFLFSSFWTWNGDVLFQIRRIRLQSRNGRNITSWKIPKPIRRIIFELPILSLIEIQSVTQRIVLILPRMTETTALVPVEPPNKRLPPWSSNDLWPLADFHESTRYRRSSHALPPWFGGGGVTRTEAGEAEGAARVWSFFIAERWWIVVHDGVAAFSVFGGSVE